MIECAEHYQWGPEDLTVLESDPDNADLYVECHARFGWRPAETVRLDSEAARRLRVYLKARTDHADYARREAQRHAQ